MNEQILKDFGLFKEKLQKVANDTNIPPKVRNIAKSWLGKIVKAPISATKALFTK
ncbi:MAG: hypothetical protein LBF15_02915 [Candidatus Peribacteria bacterium]|jgi:hypothetical protein|nr:hypothetical protein [Candidatus Peribacteria bacterium]